MSQNTFVQSYFQSHHNMQSLCHQKTWVNQYCTTTTMGPISYSHSCFATWKKRINDDNSADKETPLAGRKCAIMLLSSWAPQTVMLLYFVVCTRCHWLLWSNCSTWVTKLMDNFSFSVIQFVTEASFVLFLFLVSPARYNCESDKSVL